MRPAKRAYVIRQGDYLSKIAYTLGIDAEGVWNHPDNEELKARRPDPEILHPGDVLYLPDAPKKELPFSAGSTNKYRARVPKVDVTLIFKDGETPIADEPFEVQGLRSALAEEKAPDERKTDGEGRATLSVPVHIREIRVLFSGRNMAFDLWIGDMDPADELDGALSRLRNLGYYPDAIERDDDGEAARRAVLRFQADHAIEPTGILDEATRKALSEEHGV